MILQPVSSCSGSRFFVERPLNRQSRRRGVGGLLAIAAMLCLSTVAMTANAADAPAKADGAPVVANEDRAEEAVANGAAADDVVNHAQAAPRVGKLIRVDLPITAKTVDRVKRFADRAIEAAEADGKRPVLIFEFYVAPDQEENARHSEFADAYKLAKFLSSRRLQSVQTTVAYVPRMLPGHAVLVAMACDQIMMPADAEFGPVGVEPASIDNTTRIAYPEIADARKTLPSQVALWLLDPSHPVLKVETEMSREFVTPEQLEVLRQQRTIKSEKPLRDLVEGSPGQFTGREARSLGFVDYLPATPEDVAKALDLPARVMKEDPLLTGEVRAAQIQVKGPITAETIRRAQHSLETLGDVNFVCVWIDSPGGSATDSIELAKSLASLSQRGIRTAAYIPAEARADAALIALACDDIVLGTDATLGGSGDSVFSEEEILYTREIIMADAGPWKARPRSLMIAMIDPKFEVFRGTRLGRETFLSGEEFDERNRDQVGAQRWKKGMPVTQPGIPLKTVGHEAVTFGLADETADSFNAFKRLFHLENNPTLIEPSWADYVVETLASPGVSAILLTIAFIALYAELHSPGIGIGGFTATVCFLLFFWSHYLGGTAGWLEVVLFAAGIICLFLEFLVLPGFGVFGFGGGVLVLVSLVLASQTFVLPQNAYQFDQLQRSLVTIAGTGLFVVIGAVVLQRWLPRAPLINRMMLMPPEGAEAEAISRRETTAFREELVGTSGTTTTQLTPGGKARLGSDLVDVISGGEVIPKETSIEVVEVRGNRVIVRAIDDDMGKDTVMMNTNVNGTAKA